MPYAENQGVRIHYEIEGEGPPLVLQHGFTSHLESWRTNGYVDALRQEYQLVLVDARGHGASDKPHDPAAYAPALRAGDMAAVLDDLGVKSACFWGYSMGGRIGFAVTKYAPERLLALVVGGMHAFERRLPAASLLDGTDAEAFAAALITRWGGKPEILAPKRRKELFANDFQALAAAQQDEPSLEDVLPTIKVPCLVYAGDRDTYYEGAEKSLRAIPGGRFVALRGLNHHAAFQRAGLILPFVLPFLRSACP
jgi:pimeloyl-ACP methyl ester carboxylesterase